MKRIFTLLAAAFTLMSCEELMDFIDPRGHELTFLEGEMKAIFSDKGDTKNYKFHSDLDWSAEVSADWVEVKPSSGKAGENKIQIKVDKNKSAQKRTGYVDITLSNNESYRIELEQLAAGGNDNNGNHEGNKDNIANNEIWYTSTDGDIVTPNNFGIEIISNTYTNGRGVITFNGEVTDISDMAFLACQNLQGLVIPESVTMIGEWAFAECWNLEGINIPDAVTEIRAGAFNRCCSMKQFDGKFASDDNRCLIVDGAIVAFAPAGLTEYTISEDVKEVRGWSFSYSELQSITFHENIIQIDSYAFYDCNNLVSAYCKSVTPPAIGDNAFLEHTTEFTVYVPAESLSSYLSDTGWCEYHIVGYDFATGEIIDRPVTTEYFIEYTSVDGYLIAPNNIDAFDATFVSNSYKDGKGRLYFDREITIIGEGAFQSCNNLESVVIPESVETLSFISFQLCDNLTKVTMGEKLRNIEACVFNLCPKLTEFESIYASDDKRCIIIDGKLLAFAPADINSYTIPEGVTYIADNIFDDCAMLYEVNIPDEVTHIGNYAFDDCYNLTEIDIPSKLLTVGYGAWRSCTGLRRVNITDLSAWCRIFFNATYIDTQYYLGTNPMDYAFELALNGEVFNNLVIPEDVTAVGDYTFLSCEQLTSVTLHENIESIGIAAFHACHNLAAIYCKATTPPTGSGGMFSQNAEGRTIYVPTEAVDAYLEDEYWSKYAGAIVGYDF